MDSRVTLPVATSEDCRAIAGWFACHAGRTGGRYVSDQACPHTWRLLRRLDNIQRRWARSKGWTHRRDAGELEVAHLGVMEQLTSEYGKPLIGMALGDQRLFSGADAQWENSWNPSEPEATATLWRYMSFAKFCSLLGREALFFALVGEMEDRYEGFICPPIPRENGDGLTQQAEQFGHDLLHKITRTALISCWRESDHESSLMWETYAGAEGVAVCTTFQDLQESIRSVAELPVTFGQVEYVDYRRREVPRFGWAPLFHKRMEYRGEGEVRAILPGPPLPELDSYLHPEVPDLPLDPDVAEQRGRYISVNLEILVKDVMLPPRAAPWFAQVVKSVMQNSPIRPLVTRSSIESPPHKWDRRDTG